MSLTLIFVFLALDVVINNDFAKILVTAYCCGISAFQIIANLPKLKKIFAYSFYLVIFVSILGIVYERSAVDILNRIAPIIVWSTVVLKIQKISIKNLKNLRNVLFTIMITFAIFGVQNFIDKGRLSSILLSTNGYSLLALSVILMHPRMGIKNNLMSILVIAAAQSRSVILSILGLRLFRLVVPLSPMLTAMSVYFLAILSLMSINILFNIYVQNSSYFSSLDFLRLNYDTLFYRFQGTFIYWIQQFIENDYHPYGPSASVGNFYNGWQIPVDSTYSLLIYEFGFLGVFIFIYTIAHLLINLRHIEKRDFPYILSGTVVILPFFINVIGVHLDSLAFWVALGILSRNKYADL